MEAALGLTALFIVKAVEAMEAGLPERGEAAHHPQTTVSECPIVSLMQGSPRVWPHITFGLLILAISVNVIKEKSTLQYNSTLPDPNCSKWEAGSQTKTWLSLSIPLYSLATRSNFTQSIISKEKERGGRREYELLLACLVAQWVLFFRFELV